MGDIIHISGQGTSPFTLSSTSSTTTPQPKPTPANRSIPIHPGGWDRESFAIPTDLDAEIDQAFANVDFTLRDAGGKGWNQVFRINSYHVPLDDAGMAAMTRNFHRWMPEHKALWTCIGVPKLGLDEMRVEIEAQAHDAK